ncbi:MAG: DMT family transporter [Porphyromonas sp.]|nr:MAG: DMT family transporter [Porphyromonas sp.]
MNKFKGFLYGIVASSTFGLLPLFTLPVMGEGLTTFSILSYRMLFASILVAVLMLIGRVSFATNLKELRWFAVLGFLYYGSAALLFQAYGGMASGLATTLHFMYPVSVTIIMALVYKQRPSVVTICAIILSLVGVALLCLRESSTGVSSLLSVFLVLLSGVCYAVYLVLVSTVKRINQQNSQKLTFYVLMFSGAFFMLSTLQGGGLQIIPSASAGINLLLMATLPTLLSNLALVRSVKNIGSTLTSVLGAMEPLTAIIVGILVFDESLRGLMVVGIILILVSVSLIVLSPLLDKRIAERLQRLARNKPIH